MAHAVTCDGGIVSLTENQGVGAERRTNDRDTSCRSKEAHRSTLKSCGMRQDGTHSLAKDCRGRVKVRTLPFERIGGHALVVDLRNGVDDGLSFDVEALEPEGHNVGDPWKRLHLVSS